MVSVLPPQGQEEQTPQTSGRIQQAPTTRPHWSASAPCALLPLSTQTLVEANSEQSASWRVQTTHGQEYRHSESETSVEQNH